MPDILSCPEAAKLARLDHRTLIKALKRGEAPGLHVAGKWRVPRRALLVWLAGLDWRAAVLADAGGEPETSAAA